MEGRGLLPKDRIRLKWEWTGEEEMSHPPRDVFKGPGLKEALRWYHFTIALEEREGGRFPVLTWWFPPSEGGVMPTPPIDP